MSGGPVPSGAQGGVLLGVDVGQARVGLAASDGAGILAHPVATLARDEAGGTDLEQIAHEARAILAGDGITNAWPVMRHAANLESVRTYEGTDEIQRNILAERVLGLPREIRG